MSNASKRTRQAFRRANQPLLLERRAARHQRDDLIARYIPTFHGRRLLARAMKKPLRELLANREGKPYFGRGRRMDSPAWSLSCLPIQSVLLV